MLAGRTTLIFILGYFSATPRANTSLAIKQLKNINILSLRNGNQFLYIDITKTLLKTKDTNKSRATKASKTPISYKGLQQGNSPLCLKKAVSVNAAKFSAHIFPKKCSIMKQSPEISSKASGKLKLKQRMGDVRLENMKAVRSSSKKKIITERRANKKISSTRLEQIISDKRNNSERVSKVRYYQTNYNKRSIGKRNVEYLIDKIGSLSQEKRKNSQLHSTLEIKRKYQ